MAEANKHRITLEGAQAGNWAVFPDGTTGHSLPCQSGDCTVESSRVSRSTADKVPQPFNILSARCQRACRLGFICILCRSPAAEQFDRNHGMAIEESRKLQGPAPLSLEGARIPPALKHMLSHRPTSALETSQLPDNLLLYSRQAGKALVQNVRVSLPDKLLSRVQIKKTPEPSRGCDQHTLSCSPQKHDTTPHSAPPHQPTGSSPLPPRESAADLAAEPLRRRHRLWAGGVQAEARNAAAG